MSRNDEKYVLAIDIGTSSTKSALVSTQGNIVGTESQENRLIIGSFFLQMVEPNRIRTSGGRP
ncbi:MAG: hypothetical protein ACYS14_10925 [Planctomycetota bacterium]|jgi:glycerol kinase